MVENGTYDKSDNPLKNAPHTQEHVTSDTWSHKYTRKEAAFPLDYILQRGKFWPSVGRIQGAFGDRNLVSVVPQKSAYLGY
jgi:glycine dehydrogenase